MNRRDIGFWMLMAPLLITLVACLAGIIFGVFKIIGWWTAAVIVSACVYCAAAIWLAWE